MRSSLEEDLQFIQQTTPYSYTIQNGFVPNMKVPGKIYVNEELAGLLRSELSHYHDSKGSGFLPAIMQVANVAALPGIVGASIGLPDLHSGYGFAIGNVAAFDMNDSNAVVSPGGVGFDINCGVRLIRTNLLEKDVRPVQDALAEEMFKQIPVGVGVKSNFAVTAGNIDDILSQGMEWSVENGYSWAEDREHCEENGRMIQARSDKVSQRAKSRGIQQVGTLGAGNHYAEIQAVEEIYDEKAAKAMGITSVGQICIMIHSGSRGLGHQVATDALQIMEKITSVPVNDKQLACSYINSQNGQDYLASMSAAANFAFVNRSAMTALTRKAFSKVFNLQPDDLDMHVIYDVAHNIAKVEEHFVDGKPKTLLVHRKGSTRAFAPHHPNIPVDYQEIGQPVLIGGSMGTCSYVLTGTEIGMMETFGSTCHGAGRAQSRNAARKFLDYQTVLNNLKAKGISVKVASEKLIAEEAPESYKDVCQVVETCHLAGISKKAFKLKPIAVIKG